MDDRTSCCRAENVYDGVFSTLISEPLAHGAGRLECPVLAHRYDQLAPLVTWLLSRDPGDVRDLAVVGEARQLPRGLSYRWRHSRDEASRWLT